MFNTLRFTVAIISVGLSYTETSLTQKFLPVNLAAQKMGVAESVDECVQYSLRRPPFGLDITMEAEMEGRTVCTAGS